MQIESEWLVAENQTKLNTDGFLEPRSRILKLKLLVDT